MKLNNKGFAISGVLYSLLILFITLFIGILTILATSKLSLDKVRRDITNRLETREYKRYREDILNGADPNIGKNMIPIVIEDNGVAKVANIYDHNDPWYSYANRKWANVVTVKASARDENKYVNKDGSYKKGVEVKEEDILTYLVWIPRYRYKLWNTSNNDLSLTEESKVHSIDIIFENKNMVKSTGDIDGSYLTHPAFTLGDVELNGMWVGKFETGKSGFAETDSISPNEVRIKPNMVNSSMSSWRNIQVANAFFTTTGMNDEGNVFGLSLESDPHMMKNIEWGAVSYLSHSKYGIEKDVRLNNNSEYKTGCGALIDNLAPVTTCENQYGTVSEYPQSTTGNIYGIFDMSGGTWEYVMGILLDQEVNGKPMSGQNALFNSGFNGKLGCPTCDIDLGNDTSIKEITNGKNWPDSKYYNTYTYSTSRQQWDRRILGDATGELGPFSTNYTSSWYGKYAYFINSETPWFTRGGGNDNNVYGGIFYFANHNGRAISNHTFRVVLLDN